MEFLPEGLIHRLMQFAVVYSITPSL